MIQRVNEMNTQLASYDGKCHLKEEPQYLFKVDVALDMARVKLCMESCHISFDPIYKQWVVEGKFLLRGPHGKVYTFTGRDRALTIAVGFMCHTAMTKLVNIGINGEKED